MAIDKKEEFCRKLFLYSKNKKLSISQAIIHFCSMKDINFKDVKKCLTNHMMNVIRSELISSGYMNMKIHDIGELFD